MEHLIEQHRALIEAALAEAGGTHSFEDIERGIADGRYQFWPGLASVIVTEVVQYPQKKAAHCFLAAGEFAEIDAMRTWIEEWARGIGCTSASICGRKGWERKLSVAGYKMSAVWLEKELANV